MPPAKDPGPAKPDATQRTSASLTRKITAAAAVAALVLVVGGLSVYMLEGFISASTRVDQSDVAIQRLQEALSSLQDGETGQRGYLLTGDSAYLSPYHTSEARTDSAGLRTVAAAMASPPPWLPYLDSLSIPPRPSSPS